MFRTVRLSIIRSLFTLHSAMVYVIQVCRELSSRAYRSCSKALYKPYICYITHIKIVHIMGSHIELTLKALNLYRLALRWPQ